MRIAVFHNLPSGGAKRALFSYVRYLKSVGHHVAVHVPSTANEIYLPLRSIADGFHVYPVRKTARGLIKSSLRYVPPPYPSMADLEWTHKRIAEAINAGPYDVVFSEQDQLTMSPFVLRYLKKPTVYYCPQPFDPQGVVFQDASPNGTSGADLPTWKRAWRAYIKHNILKIERENASRARYILTNSYFSREAIMRAYRLNAYVSYLGVDTELFRPLTCQTENFVLSVGSCHPHKGHDFSIRSLGLIDERRRPKMLIVSNSTTDIWAAHLLRMAAGLGVDLTIKTLVPDTDLVLLYNTAKLFVYSSILEPFGLAPVEAMACGTPVVAVKEGGVRESVVHNETGVLTQRDEHEFAAAISQLLDDDGLRRKMGDSAVEAVRGFWTLDHAGARLSSHLNRAAGAGSAAADAETILKAPQIA